MFPGPCQPPSEAQGQAQALHSSQCNVGDIATRKEALSKKVWEMPYKARTVLYV